jgi:hypothetical protein
LLSNLEGFEILQRDVHYGGRGNLPQKRVLELGGEKRKKEEKKKKKKERKTPYLCELAFNTEFFFSLSSA